MGGVLGFFAGFFAPFRGAAAILRSPRRRALAAWPVALNVALVVLVGWAWFAFAGGWFEELAFGAEGDGDAWYVSAGRWFLRLLTFVAALPVVLGAYLAAAGVVGGPFYEALCADVEAEVLGEPVPPPPRRLLRVALDGVKIEIGNLVVSVVGGVVAFLCVALFPPFGVVPATGIGWFLAGFGYLAYPFDRLATTLREKVGVVSRHLGVALGFGCATYFLLVPLVTVPFVAPCAVAGAALLFPGARRRARSGSVPPVPPASSASRP
jgi:uncharacterized protein involved in cysteine biosynthesis